MLRAALLTGGLLAASGAAPASAHVEHGSTSGTAVDAVPHLSLLALAVAGGLLLGPALTRVEGSAVRRLWALRLLALLSAVGLLVAGPSPTRVAVGLLLTAVIGLPGTPPGARGAVLLLAPSLLLRPLEADLHVLVTAGHVVGAGLWAGTVVHLLTLPGLDRRAWRAGTRPAVAGIAISSVSGVLSANQVGLTPGTLTDSAYGTAVLVKAAVVALLVVAVGLLGRRTRHERVLRTESLVLLGIVATGVLLGVAGPPVGGLRLPPGLAVQDGHSLLLTADGDRRLLRVAPAAFVTVAGRPVPTSTALDGSTTVELPERGTVAVDGREVELPERAVPLSPGPGDDGERLARTLGRVAGERAEAAVDPLAGLAGQRADLARRQLRSPVVVVDGDPRGPAVARALGARTVASSARRLPAGTDVAYVATSWAGAGDALALASAEPVLGGAVLLPWLITPVTLDLAQRSVMTALSDVDLEGPGAFGYRRMLAQLPGERPTLVGLRAWQAAPTATWALTYAATPVSIFPKELSHDVHASGLPAWTSGGALVATRRQQVAG